MNPKAKHCSPMPAPMRPTSCAPAPISTPLPASSARSIPHSRAVNEALDRLADKAATRRCGIQTSHAPSSGLSPSCLPNSRLTLRTSARPVTAKSSFSCTIPPSITMPVPLSLRFRFTPAKCSMGFAPSASRNSRSVAHLANYPRPNLSTNSADESSIRASRWIVAGELAFADS